MSTPGTEVQLRTPDRQDDWNYAKALATAGDQLPRKFQGNPGNVLVAMEYARSLGLPLMQGLIGVQVIEGVPSLSAQTMQALVRRAGHTLRMAGDDRAAWCEIVRKDDPAFTYRAEFTLADAERAGLLRVLPDGTIRSRTRNDKPTPWESHPRAMLKARALSECARMAAGDVLAGVAYLPDEIGGEAMVIDGAGEWSDTAAGAPAGTSGPPPAENAATDQREAATRPDRATVAEAESQSDRNTAEERKQWDTELDAAIDEYNLPAIVELGQLANRRGHGDQAARARGAYERVKLHLAEFTTGEPAEAEE